MRASGRPSGFQIDYMTLDLSGASVVNTIPVSFSSGVQGPAGRGRPGPPREFIGSSGRRLMDLRGNMSCP